MAEEKKRDNDYTIDIGRERSPTPGPKSPPPNLHSLQNHPILAVLSYCGSSILMTVTNKYVLSGMDYNLNFLLLCVQVRIGQNRHLRSEDLRFPPVHRLRYCNRILEAIQRNHVPRLQH